MLSGAGVRLTGNLDAILRCLMAFIQLFVNGIEVPILMANLIEVGQRKGRCTLGVLERLGGVIFLQGFKQFQLQLQYFRGLLPL